MMSAKLGQPPANQRDKLIIEGFYRWKLRHPGPGLQHPPIIPVQMPPNAPHDNRAGELYGAYISCMCVVILLVGTRLSLRAFKKT